MQRICLQSKVVKTTLVWLLRTLVFSIKSQPHMNHPPDIEATFLLLGTHISGRKGPVFSGYRPIHKIHENYFTSGLHEYIGAGQVEPGKSVSAAVWFVTPEVYPKSLWIGREIDVTEGSRTVGTLTVTKINNELLRGSPDAFNPLWADAGSLGDGTNYAGE